MGLVLGHPTAVLMAGTAHGWKTPAIHVSCGSVLATECVPVAFLILEQDAALPKHSTCANSCSPHLVTLDPTTKPPYTVRDVLRPGELFLVAGDFLKSVVSLSMRALGAKYLVLLNAIHQLVLPTHRISHCDSWLGVWLLL